jgi:hypothetical protein
MSFLKVCSIAASATFILTISACKKRPDPNPVNPPQPTTKEIHFSFNNNFGDEKLEFNKAYTTPHGEQININVFKYYISNIVLKAADGKEYAEPESYHLIDHSVAGSMHFHLEKVPVNNYTSVSFLIGVDSTRNVSGSQTGALAVENGMFWTWKTGYIMAKLEGTSPQSGQMGNMVTYHIGGFSGAYNGVRRVTLNFSQNVNLSSLESGQIDLKADASKWFAPNVIKIADRSEIMNTSETSKAIADNYASMFSITYSGGATK